MTLSVPVVMFGLEGILALRVVYIRISKIRT